MKCNSTLPRPLQPGFTLIELLVVVTIIIALAALGFMGSSVLIKRAAAVKDVTNMRNLWTGIVLYAGENGGTLPFLVKL